MSLRGTLPSRNSGGEKQRTWIALGVAATAAGIQFAERQARRLSLLLDAGTFSWAEFEPEASEESLPDVERAIANLRDVRLSQRIKERTWRTNYSLWLERIPAGELTEAGLLAAIATTNPRGTNAPFPH